MQIIKNLNIKVIKDWKETRTGPLKTSTVEVFLVNSKYHAVP